MRKLYFVFALALCLAGNGLSRNVGKAGVERQNEPGARCTRLTYPPASDRKKAAAAVSGTALPGTRCLRLNQEPAKGVEILPNRPPKVGLSSSTSHVGPDAGSEVKLKTIACDLDDDTLLYTYSATAGRIGGDGADAVWDLSGAQPGQYTVAVEVDDGCGCIAFVAATVTVK